MSFSISAKTINFFYQKNLLEHLFKIPHCKPVKTQNRLLTGTLEKNPKEPYISIPSSKSFGVAHYSGTVTYQLKDILAKNRDLLAPEVVETMRMSKDNAIKDLFSNRLTKSGNLTVCREKALMVKTKNHKISRWGAALMAEKTPIRVRF